MTAPALMTLPADAEAAMAAAVEVAGLDDFGDNRFVEGLERYIASVQAEAGLSAMGEAVVHGDLNSLLVNRLRFEDDLKRHPEILDEEIADVLVITGLPRTGTTKLQQLIGRDPGVLSLPYWRVLNMAPLPGSPVAGPDPRIELAENIVAAQAQMAPEIMSAHAAQAGEPEEDIFVMRMTFESQANAMFDHVPSFYRWVAEQPTAYSYGYLRKLLQYTQWQTGGGRARPWVLKSPLHLSQLNVLLETFGNVTVVQCHRDPVITMPSTMRLYEVMWTGRGGGADAGELSRLLLDRWTSEIAAGLRLRDELGDRLPVVDMAYRDVAGDGIAAVAAVYERWGRPLDDATSTAMSGWEQANPQYRFGRHQYSLERYGLDAAGVRGAFDEYLDRFGEYL